MSHIEELRFINDPFGILTDVPETMKMIYKQVILEGICLVDEA